MNADVFGLLRTQARLQRASEIATADAPDGAVPAPVFRVVDRAGLAALPPADPGDLFFDFEGDPLYTEGTARARAPARSGASTTCSAGSTRARRSRACGRTRSRKNASPSSASSTSSMLHRAAHPGMHIYHYAPYEPTHLLAMAARHGTGEAQVDRLLRDGVFVDLYPIVRRALRVGSRSYSIKKLEPLYMGDETRQSDVQRGDESIVRYVEARMLAGRGRATRARERSSTTSPTTTATTASRPVACVTGCGSVRTSSGSSRPPTPNPMSPVTSPRRAPSRCSATGRAAVEDGRERSGPPPRIGRNRLLPARGEELLGDALPAPSRTRIGVGAESRCRGHRCVALRGRGGLASRRGTAGGSRASCGCAANWLRARACRSARTCSCSTIFRRRSSSRPRLAGFTRITAGVRVIEELEDGAIVEERAKGAVHVGGAAHRDHAGSSAACVVTAGRDRRVGRWRDRREPDFPRRSGDRPAAASCTAPARGPSGSRRSR